MTTQKTSKKSVSKPARTLPNQPAASTLALFPLGFESLAGIAAFGLFSFLLLIAPQNFSGFWPATYEYWSYSLFLGIAACVFVLLALEPQSKIQNPKSKIALCLILFFAWSVVSVLGTVYLHDSILELARVAGVLACFFLTRAFLSSEYSSARAMWMLLAVMLGGVIVCLPAIFDFVATRNPRQFGTFYNPNLFANYSAMALPLAAAGVLLFRRRAQQFGDSAPLKVLIVGIVVLIILALGLIVTSSKGGFLSALCGGLVFIAAVFRAKGERAKEVLRTQKVAFAIVAVLVLVGGGVLFSQTILPRLTTNLESDHSTMFRVYTWKGTLDMALARPLTGWGIGSFPSAYTQFAQTGYTRSAHQSWLQIAAETGFPAMLFLLAACGFAFARGWKALKESSWPIAAGSLGALTAFCVHGLTDSGWGIISIGVLLMGVLALLDSGSPSSESSIVNRQSSINWPFLLAALPLALGSWFYQRAQSGEDLRTESRELMARGMTSSAVEKAREATQVDSLSARLWANLAQAQDRAGQDTGASYMIAMTRQPTRALNYLSLAENAIANDYKGVGNLFDKAIELDPNDPEIRLTHGNWLLENGSEKGWEDLEYIASLADKPYGKYPATPEMVDLNFARAYAKLAARDVERKDFANARNFIERGLADIEFAREHEARRREMEIAVRGAADETRAQELNELEAQFNLLREKLPATN